MADEEVIKEIEIEPGDWIVGRYKRDKDGNVVRNPKTKKAKLQIVKRKQPHPKKGYHWKRNQLPQKLTAEERRSLREALSGGYIPDKRPAKKGRRK